MFLNSVQTNLCNGHGEPKYHHCFESFLACSRDVFSRQTVLQHRWTASAMFYIVNSSFSNICYALWHLAKNVDVLYSVQVQLSSVEIFRHSVHSIKVLLSSVVSKASMKGRESMKFISCLYFLFVHIPWWQTNTQHNAKYLEDAQ